MREVVVFKLIYSLYLKNWRRRLCICAPHVLLYAAVLASKLLALFQIQFRIYNSVLTRSMQLVIYVIIALPSFGAVNGNSIIFSSQNDNSKNTKGFNWYNDQYLIDNTKLVEKTNLQTAVSPLAISAKDRINKLSQQLESAMNNAIDNPTLENVIIAQRLQKQVMDKSHNFAKMWRLATIVDSSLTNPAEHHNILHRKVYQQQQEVSDFHKLRSLSQDYGLLFQFHPACKFCHKFAPIVKEFATRHNFQILAISNEAGEFYGIEAIKEDGKLLPFNPEQKVPALYLFHRLGEKIYPVAWGIVDSDTIAENILSLELEYKELKR